MLSGAAVARIEIIDDDKEMAENLALSLRAHGHTVETLYQTEGAARKLAQNKPDLLVLDVMFPGNPIGGFDLAREIRATKQLKLLPIILLTGVNQHYPMDFSGKDIDPTWMPVQDFMEKPPRIASLLKKIARLLKNPPPPARSSGGNPT
ncbi:MAG: hypothetical protein C0404_06055 [Verrucomicrobia bacterium]|nr:hypothetical protein [Verrucomicrobiota bacterium]